MLPCFDADRYRCVATCPECIWTFEETYKEYALRYLMDFMSTPDDGICLKGVKWIHYGADYGLKNRNACCCHTRFASQEPCNATSRVICPLLPKVKNSEPIGEFCYRAGQTVKNDAPSDGCCLGGTFKWLLPPVCTGASDNICVCVDNHDIIVPENNKTVC